MPPEQQTVPDLRTVEVAGSRTAVYGYGPEDPAAPAVLAVHGFRGTHFGLDPLARALAARGRRVLVPDLPATGASTPLDGPHDAAGYARWLAGLSDALTDTGAGPPVLLGHSFGSVVVAAAVDAGIAHPAVVLINPIATPPLEVSRRGAVAVTRAYYGLARRLPARPARSLLASKAVAVLTSELMATSSDRELRRWMRSEHVRQADLFADRDAVLEAFAASTDGTVRDHAARFTAPTLLLVGERDDLGPLESQRRLAELIGGSTLHVLPDVGHLVHYEATEPAAEAITDWLDAPRP